MNTENNFDIKLKAALARLKAFYTRFIKIRGTPEQISLGMALGLFIGMSPFMGFHTIAAVALASLFGWSKIAAGIGVCLTNPFTAPIIYPITYRLGARITGVPDSANLAALFKDDGVIGLIKSSPMIIADLVIGGVIIGIPLALIGYYSTLKMVTSTRERWQKRQARRKEIGI